MEAKIFQIGDQVNYQILSHRILVKIVGTQETLTGTKYQIESIAQPDQRFNSGNWVNPKNLSRVDLGTVDRKPPQTLGFNIFLAGGSQD